MSRVLCPSSLNMLSDLFYVRTLQKETYVSSFYIWINWNPEWLHDLFKATNPMLKFRYVGPQNFSITFDCVDLTGDFISVGAFLPSI